MDTETVNRVITEITNRLGVGYSTFSDAVGQYAQTKATESFIFLIVFFIVALLIIAIFFFAVLPNPGIFCLTGYINWSNAPQGMFLREIIKAVK